MGADTWTLSYGRAAPCHVRSDSLRVFPPYRDTRGRYGNGGGRRADPSEAISALTAMGFTQSKARGALRECNFNVELAVEWLFANCL